MSLQLKRIFWKLHSDKFTRGRTLLSCTILTVVCTILTCESRVKDYRRPHSAIATGIYTLSLDCQFRLKSSEGKGTPLKASEHDGHHGRLACCNRLQQNIVPGSIIVD